MSLFGWGKIKQKQLVKDFGSEDQLAAALPLPGAPPLAPPDLTPPAPLIDLDNLAATALTGPLLDLTPSFRELPPLAPRQWPGADASAQYYGGDPSQLSYLEVSRTTVADALDLAEHLGDRIKMR